jgi:hypothetical protein
MNFYHAEIYDEGRADRPLVYYAGGDTDATSSEELLDRVITTHGQKYPNGYVTVTIGSADESSTAIIRDGRVITRRSRKSNESVSVPETDTHSS